jgi:hypothetical protein
VTPPTTGRRCSRTPSAGGAALLGVSAALALGQPALAWPAAASPVTTTEAPALTADTQFSTPAPDPGAKQQIADLKSGGQFDDAELISDLVATPQAV